MITIGSLRNELDIAYRSIKTYLFDLAKQDPNAEFWQQQVNGTLSGYPQFILQDLQDSFFELAEKMPDLTESHREVYAQTQVVCCLLSLFNQKMNQDTHLDALKILHQALYKPGQLIPVTEDITPEKHDNIEIFEHDITQLVCALTKAHFLFYIVDKLEKIKEFLHQFPNIENNHLDLTHLNIAWLEKEFQHIKKVADSPYHYAKFMILPAIGGYIPFEVIADEIEPSLWQSLWQTHLILPWKFRFSIGRLHARFVHQDYRVETHNSALPNNYNQKNFVSQFLFHLCFWTNLCLVYHLFKSSYLQAIWQNIKNSLNYIKGSHSFFSGMYYSFNLTVDFLKILFAPIVLVMPLLLGISSLPFLGLRWFFDKFSPHYFKTSLHIFLDALETLKDIALLIGTLMLLSPLIEASIALPPILTLIGGIVSTLFCLVTLLAFTAIGLSPHILVLLLGIGGYNKIVELAFSPLISFGGIIGIVSFPLFLATLTLPRFAVEMAYSLQALLLPLMDNVQNRELEIEPQKEYDPIEELQLFVKGNAFLLQYNETKESSNSLAPPPHLVPNEPIADKNVHLSL